MASDAKGNSKSLLIIAILVVVIIALIAVVMFNHSASVQELSASISPIMQNINVTEVATITASASSGQQPYYFQWYNDTSGSLVPIAGQSGVSLLVSGDNAGTYKYSVSVSDSESPAKTVSSPQATVIVSVPSLTVSVSPQSNKAYVGQGIILTAAALHGVPPYSYQWYNDTSGTGVPIAGQIGATLSLSPSVAGEFKYYASATDSETPAKTVYSNPVSLLVNSTPSVTITITNSQPAAVSYPFQQMITFNPSQYAQFEAFDLGNIRFYQGSTELYSWCESGCNSNSQNAVFWVKIPGGIGADSSEAVTMVFEPKSVEYDGVYAGEAPQLSPVYAEYDNGANVFLRYENFEGASVPSGWSLQNSAGNGVPTYIDNKAVLSSVNLGGNYGSLVSDWQINGTSTIDAFVLSQSTSNGQDHVIYSSSSPSSFAYQPDSVNYQNGSGLECESNAGGTPNAVFSASPDPALPAVISVYGANMYANYALVGSLNSGSILTSGFLGMEANSGNSANFTVQWVRIRATPPNGVMPSASFATQ